MPPPHRTPLRKTDTHLLPLLSLLFLLNALDKTNLASAETAHFSRDLGLSRADVHAGVAVFFALFVALQPVGAALGRRVGCRRWVPACMALWGGATVGMGMLRRGWGCRAALMVLRGVVGGLEAGFYPTTVAYLATFYTRAQFARRLAIFYGQAALAPAVGGVLAWGVFSWFGEDSTTSPPSSTVDGGGGYAGEPTPWRPWQLLFLIEGGLTVAVAAVAALYLPHGPRTAWFLTPTERVRVHEAVRRDRSEEMAFHSFPSLSPTASDDDDDDDDDAANDGAASPLLPPSPNPQKQNTTLHALLALLTSPYPPALLALNILTALPAISLSLFLPLLLVPLAPNPALANLATAPPFLLAAAVLWVVTGVSDRCGDRTGVVLVALGGVGVGCVGLGVGRAPGEAPGGAFGGVELGLKYMSLCVLLAGAYVASPLTVAWITDNVPGGGAKRALWLGINGWGNVAGVLAAWVFRPVGGNEAVVTDPLRAYRPAFRSLLLCTLLALAGYASFRRHLQRVNAARAALLASWSAAEVQAERVAGRGPAMPRGWWERGVFCVLEGVVRAVGGVLGVRGRGERVLREWREGPREGDERVTFVYGL